MDSYDLFAATQLVVRWIHVFAAILWIGQTYLFNFMEANLERGQGEDENLFGKLWMVHGGGFYLVEKQRMPEIMPMTLHWFKWEAAATWLSGAVLIALTYYMGGLLVDSGMDYATAAATGVGSIVVSWLVYDGMVRSPLGRRGAAFAVVSLILIMALHYLLATFMSGRSAYIHVGAVLGTIMAANVWLRILPSQRIMLRHAKRGETFSSAVAKTGPLRSKHNTYVVVPLVLIMISNHYPTISYGSSQSTLVLGACFVVGWAFARWMRGPDVGSP